MLSRMKSQRGSIAIMAAIFMTVFITVLAFMVNAGYLYGEKNRYQNAAEAAAMAGAARLCDEDAIEVATQIAMENGAPQGSVTGTLGFYDVESEQFYPEGSDEYPDGEYNNAVMVRIQRTENTILGGFLGKDKTQVGASAVAYLVRYGMLALGEKEGDGIEVGERSTSFKNGEPIFKNGDIHANGDIIFRNNAPGIDEETVSVTAHGMVTGYDSGISDANIVELPPVDVYLDKLYAKADKILDESAFTSTSWELKEDGNYYRRSGSRYLFGPHPGDHGGAIYYFDFSNPNSRLEPANRFGNSARITNLIIATNRSVYFYPPNHSALHLWGGDGHTVMIIAKGDIDLGKPSYFFPCSDSYCNFEGAVFWAGNDIYYRTGSGHDFHGSSPGTRWLRMIADGKISIIGKTTVHPLQFDFLFGPPCPPSIVKLGRVERAE
ncbi:MAG: hypothetical protein DRH43_06685 [Deltaproteobacteria bacterium]|nr:MAG: hypothetical protein DRH43_06685 [Deltaproteobacteria bacterium]